MNYDPRMPNAGPVVTDPPTAICCRSELTASHSRSHLSRDIHHAECFDPTSLKNSLHILVFKQHLLIVFGDRKSSFKGNCVQPNRSQLVWTAAQINNSDAVCLFVGLLMNLLFSTLEVVLFSEEKFTFTANRKEFAFVTESYSWCASADLIKLLQK